MLVEAFVYFPKVIQVAGSHKDFRPDTPFFTNASPKYWRIA